MPHSDTFPSSDDFSLGTTSSSIGAGYVLFDRFRLIRLAAREPFSIIWLAEDERLKRPVSLKLLPEVVTHDQTALSDIHAAVRSSLQLTHPHIVRCFDCVSDNNRTAIVEEFVDGQSLAALLTFQPNHVFASHEIADWIGQVISALSYGHDDVHLIHGAIRPENLLIDTSAQLKLTNFGIENTVCTSLDRIARRFNRSAPSLYLSPGQLLGDSHHPADDIYSFGATLYELLTGSPPFFSGDIALQIQHKTPQPLSQRIAAFRIQTTVPSNWEDVIMRCLAKQRNDRPSLSEIAEQLGLPIKLWQYKSHRESSDRFIEHGRAAGCHIEFESKAAPPAQTPPKSPPPDGPNDPGDSSSPDYPPENVQFTVFRPRSITRERWRRMLIYTHLDDGPSDQPTPLDQVREEVTHLLRHEAKDYTDVTKDSRSLIPREAEIQLVPLVTGIRFNPAVRSFFWSEGMHMHREEFEVRATTDTLAGEVTGTLTVYLGVLIIAELPLRFQVIAQPSKESHPADNTSTSAKPYRQIFPSYSRRDDLVVQQLESYVSTLGDSYLKDVTTLRAGEEWSPRLLQLIEEADVFQLFWSPRSALSKEVEKEWRHALLQPKPNFIRPTYWEAPMPKAPAEMRHLHFQKLVLTPQSSSTQVGDSPPRLDLNATLAHPAAPVPRTSEPPSLAQPAYAPSQQYPLSTSAFEGDRKTSRTALLAITTLLVITTISITAFFSTSTSIPLDLPTSALPTPPLPSPHANTQATVPLVTAELGVFVDGHFVANSSFKSGDLLTLRLRVSRNCYLRVIHLSASDVITLLTPLPRNESHYVRSGTDVYLPDPQDPSPGALRYAFKLSHEPGYGPPLHEALIIQVANEPFSFEGTTQTPSLYPIYADTSLERALSLGIPAVRGLSEPEAQKKMESLLSQCRLNFTIFP